MSKVGPRKRVAERLQLMQATADTETLLGGLEDASPLVVEVAAARVDRHAGDTAAGPLLRAYLRLDDGAPASDPGCRARLALLLALGRLGAPEGEEAAIRGIRTVQVETVGFGSEDTATALRGAAAGLMAVLGLPQALLQIGLLLFDFEPNAACSHRERPFAKAGTRAAAARSLGALGDSGGAALLAVKLKFPGEEIPEVLSECMDALVVLRDPSTVALLQPFLESLDPYLAATAATGIATAGRESAVPILEAAVDRAVSGAQASLVYAIGSIRADAARQALRRLRGHEAEQVRRVAVELTE